ncbi:hypothetical protein JI57_01400 [Psychromonas sp. PRT-SC03]|nr:hypothetical protein JI57_01400 [Psychromonas sp. PRT-SC03]
MPSKKSSKVDTQRENYKTAKEMLSAGKLSEYAIYRNKVGDYALAPYLDNQSLLLELNDKSPQDINTFTEKYASFPFIKYLPYKYLSYLGKNEKWPEFLTYFPNEPHSEKLRCYYYRATLSAGNWHKAWQGANKLWLKGYSVHSACDPLFNDWQKAGGKTDAQILDRISIAYQTGNTRLLKILSKALKYKSSKKTADKILNINNHTDKVGNVCLDEKLIGKSILPIGFKNSPAISNIVFRKFDCIDAQYTDTYAKLIERIDPQIIKIEGA